MGDLCTDRFTSKTKLSLIVCSFVCVQKVSVILCNIQLCIIFSFNRIFAVILSTKDKKRLNPKWWGRAIETVKNYKNHAFGVKIAFHFVCMFKDFFSLVLEIGCFLSKYLYILKKVFTFYRVPFVCLDSKGG